MTDVGSAVARNEVGGCGRGSMRRHEWPSCRGIVARGIIGQRKPSLKSLETTGTASTENATPSSSFFSYVLMVEEFNKNIRGKPGKVGEFESTSLVDTVAWYCQIIVNLATLLVVASSLSFPLQF